MRGEERRASILAKSKGVFADKGYKGASTAELARACGVTEPILYKHFGSKKRLYTTVLTTICKQFLDRFRSMVEKRAGNDLTDCLTNLLLDYRKAAMRDHEGIHLLLNAMLESDDRDIAEIARMHNHEAYTLIFDLLEKAQDHGILPARLELSVATWGYLSFLFALQYRAKANIFEKFNEQTIREINRLWLRSLCLE
jgi:AcrR family transcriptional regulator